MIAKMINPVVMITSWVINCLPVFTRFQDITEKNGPLNSVLTQLKWNVIAANACSSNIQTKIMASFRAILTNLKFIVLCRRDGGVSSKKEWKR
jgi:hypothetical protein